jgi:glyoxylase-like metal-dependent hydrolase (beta-lactamase superfamily II)
MQKLLSGILLLISSASIADVKLYVFDCGRISFDDVSAFGLSNEETDVRQLFVPCYLIEHDAGRLLWDAGLPLDIIGQGKVESRPGVAMWYDNSLLDQMAAMGIAPGDVDFAAFSHMHYDHVGAANAFKGSTILIQTTEYVAAFEHAEDNPVFNPALYAELENAERISLNGDHDVFGDGSVKIISAPGHTPGHQTLLLELDNFGPLMLSGDLYHFKASRALRRTPEFNTDAAETLRSMDKVEAIVEATGATFWIEHNQALADTLNMAPAYYD